MHHRRENLHTSQADTESKWEPVNKKMQHNKCVRATTKRADIVCVGRGEGVVGVGHVYVCVCVCILLLLLYIKKTVAKSYKLILL